MAQTVIRIEHSDGNGMFRTKIQRPTIEEIGLQSLVDRHYCQIPPPRDDDGINRWIKDDEFCAFKSLEQIKNHVLPEEIQVLLDNDFRVYMIEVSECVEGKHQCLFKKENIISKKDITHELI